MAVMLAPLAPLAGKATLTLAKGALSRAALRSFTNGAAWSAGAHLVDMIAEWARSIGGEFDTTDDSGGIDGCGEMAPGGYGQFQYNRGGESWTSPQDSWIFTRAVRINPLPPTEDSYGNGWSRNCEVYSETDGTTRTLKSFDSEAEANAARFRIDPIEGECAGSGSPSAPNMDEPVELPPMQAGDCNINVVFHGFLGNPDETGNLLPVYEFTPILEERASGGVITGECNFQPTIVVGDGGDGKDPPVIIPTPDFPERGDDWWKAIAGGLAGAAANQIIDGVIRSLSPTYEAGSFTLTAPCDYTENGDNVSYFFPFPAGSFEQRVIDHQMAILDTLQYHLNSKTPTCSSERTPLEGEWVTTRWLSDEKMDHSGVRLRKLFRYRSKSSIPLEQLSAYWERFTWQAGPVCVKHKGAWWGSPQVWASTAEEGKRLIRFAGAEAGLDPDQAGEWEISGSRSPRYGMSGTMRIQCFKGFPWVASRQGSEWPNVLAKES